jgi:large subunit ribosomal protein L4e
MKTKIFDINGKEKSSIELPNFFSEKIREDILSKVLETKKTKQPYAPSLVGGKQHSASGIAKHTRNVWKTQYGKGLARVSRKIMSRRGTQFNWVGAETAQTRGGRRAHPPRVISMINSKKINKRELEIALISALSATANEKKVSEKYSRLEGKKIENLPFIVEEKFLKLKTKELLSSLKKILGDLYEVAIRKKKIRSGKGKSRGRKYKSNAGILLVTGNREKFSTNAFEVKDAKNVSVMDLAKGGAGRLTVYTEQAISDLAKRVTSSSKSQTKDLGERK